MNSVAQRVKADLVWVDGAFRAGHEVHVDAAGRIADHSPPGTPLRPLTGRALLPGFVNAHSHAFQRGLRGLGERFPRGTGSFWTWREAMYELVQRLDPDELESLCTRTFREMLASGITCVGEFHYLHHADGAARDYQLDRRVLKAARTAGIRIVMLMSYYRSGGFGQELEGGQRRFATRSVDEFFVNVDALQSSTDGVMQRIGIAPHSVRATPAEDLAPLWHGARKRQMVVHMHLEEQTREIEECVRALGARPLTWVRKNLPIDSFFTAIHATHTPAEELRPFLESGARVCICPLTEANLGDGAASIADMNRHAHGICLGSDSNARIDFLEELRWLEYGQRLVRRERGVCVDANGSVAPRLLDYATRNGAAALGVPAGVIEPGRHADFVSIDLSHPALAGAQPETLVDALIFGCGADAISEVCVGGTWQTLP